MSGVHPGCLSCTEVFFIRNRLVSVNYLVLKSTFKIKLLILLKNLADLSVMVKNRGIIFNLFLLYLEFLVHSFFVFIVLESRVDDVEG